MHRCLLLIGAGSCVYMLCCLTFKGLLDSVSGSLCWVLALSVCTMRLDSWKDGLIRLHLQTCACSQEVAVCSSVCIPAKSALYLPYNARSC